MPDHLELLIASNPDHDSTLPYLLRLPLGSGLIFRTKGTWPRTTALFCYPVPRSEWPAEPDLVERIPLRSCVQRGAAIDVIADRVSEPRSQIVYTKARGRDMVFWQSPKTRKQARPNVRTPSARAAGVAELEILIDVYERYPYTFAGQQVRTTRRALSCGDYAVEVDGAVVTAVERKSVADLSSSLTSGRLRFAMAELASLPRAAVVVEERYSTIFKQDFVRPAVLADGLAELQIRYPSVPITFCDTRKLAEEWTYRYLAAAWTWLSERESTIEEAAEPMPFERGSPDPSPEPVEGSGEWLRAPTTEGPSPGELRVWARLHGWTVSERGRISAEIRSAWRSAHEH